MNQRLWVRALLGAIFDEIKYVLCNLSLSDNLTESLDFVADQSRAWSFVTGQTDTKTASLMFLSSSPHTLHVFTTVLNL